MFQVAPCTGADMWAALLAWSVQSFCFRSSHSMPLTLFSLWTKGVLGHFTRQSTEQSQWQTAGTSSVWALRGLPLRRLLTVPVSRNFLNSLLTSRFVQLISGNSSVNLCAVYPFDYKLFIKILSSSLISCWLLTNTAGTSAVTNFRCLKLIAKVNR